MPLGRGFSIELFEVGALDAFGAADPRDQDAGTRAAHR